MATVTELYQSVRDKFGDRDSNATDFLYIVFKN